MEAGWFSAVATCIAAYVFCCEQGGLMVRPGVAMGYAELEIDPAIFRAT